MASNSEYEQRQLFKKDNEWTYHYDNGLSSCRFDPNNLPHSASKKITIKELIDNYPLTEFQVLALKNRM